MPRRPKSTLQVVREGNPGHRPIREGVVLPPVALVEPDWLDLLPSEDDETLRVRADASQLWQRLAPVLEKSVGLVHAQQVALDDYCLSVARVRQGERALSREGVILASPRADRGSVRNPWTTVLNQYRPHLRSLAAELGLTPSAASQLTRPPMEDADDPFD